MKNLFWWSRKRLKNEEFENFGDVLVPYLFTKITDINFRWANPNKKKYFSLRRKKNYLIIGSIIHFATEDSIIWGAGIISKNSKIPKAKYSAVRGPLSAEKIRREGIEVPEKYGDPALFLALYKNEFINTKTPYIGVVPHYVDYESIQKDSRFDSKNLNIINVLTNNPIEVIKEIGHCKLILSSSLHGIIVAHALGIPAIWIKVSENLYGDDIKFHDYYKSIGIEEPLCLNIESFSFEKLENLSIIHREKIKPEEEIIQERIRDLVSTSPFKFKKEFLRILIKYESGNL